MKLQKIKIHDGDTIRGNIGKEEQNKTALDKNEMRDTGNKTGNEWKETRAVTTGIIQ